MAVSGNAGELLNAGLRRLREDPDIEALLKNRTGEVETLLNRYLDEIELFNPAYGLVGAGSREELVIKHILDSLSPLGIIRRLRPAPPAGKAAVPVIPFSIADAGSGAGLPGIPLAVAMPDVPVTLMERMGRRAGFLENVRAVLGLSNVAVEEGEIEKTPSRRFSLITFRALKALEPAILKSLFRLLLPGGFLAAYKGRKDTIEAEMEGVKQHAGKWKILPCPVPFLEEERHLVIIRDNYTDPEKTDPNWRNGGYASQR
ncbi:MAG: 16S rRNA (guanine(527)-N(7))-methyltransferase RsmG [Treponema sp.]|jgi:16S rRNA (guanine527-N7)-methyltransferase|nr:16S rRNA (guanine(527)-N(7))-methyltransferase RsmG [Treponema sp.]